MTFICSCQNYNKSKLAYAVCCALPSNSVRYTCTYILYYINMNIHISFLLIYDQMTRTRNIFYKTKPVVFLVSPNTQYLLGQHRQLTDSRNFCGVHVLLRCHP